MNRIETYVIARQLVGRPVNGEFRRLSPEVRTLADQLATMPDERRSEAFKEWLSGRTDADAVSRSIASTNPDGPAPEPEDDGWGPIGSPDPPTVEPFPLGVLPIAARDLAEAASRSIPACPTDYVAIACLVAASAVAGRSAILRVKPGYHEQCAIYAAIVGNPSAGKTPAINAAMRPVWKIERDLKAKHSAELEAWEEKAGDEEPRGPRPVLERIVTTDATVERIAPILDKSPRGLLVSPDELTKWVMGMNQYKNGKGSDRQFYMATFSGSPIRVDRAKYDEPIAIDHPFLSVVGGITPDMLSSLPEEKGRGDGFIDRLIFGCPDPVPRRYSEDGIPEHVADGWASLIFALRRRPMVASDDDRGPGIVPFSAGALDAWRAWVVSHYEEQEADGFPDSLVGPWGKLESYAARFCLLLHLMDLASDPTSPADALPPIPRSIIEDAGRLVAYFKSHARRAHWAINGKHRDKGGETVGRIVKWFRADPDSRSVFSEAAVRRHLTDLRDDPVELAEALGAMVGRGWIRALPMPERPKGTKGRKPSPAYAVHPDLIISDQYSGNKCNNEALMGREGGEP